MLFNLYICPICWLLGPVTNPFCQKLIGNLKFLQLQFSSFSGSLCCLSARNNLMDILHLYFRSTRIVKKSLTFYAFCNHISQTKAEYFYRIRHKKTVSHSLQVLTCMWSGEVQKVFFLSTEAKLSLVQAISILTEKNFSTSCLFWITKHFHIFVFVRFAKVLVPSGAVSMEPWSKGDFAIETSDWKIETSDWNRNIQISMKRSLSFHLFKATGLF